MGAQDTELMLRLDALVATSISSVPLYRDMSWKAHPLNEVEQKKVHASIVHACIAAIEPGSVVRIACEWPSQLVLTTTLLKELLPRLKDLTVVEAQSAAAHYEFTNNSAIFVVLAR